MQLEKMTFGFSAGNSFGNKFGAPTYGAYGASYGQQAAAQPPPFLIGTQTVEFNADLLQQVHDKFTSGFQPTGAAGQSTNYTENDVFKKDFYVYKDPAQTTTSGFQSGAFGARPGFGAYGQSAAATQRLSQADNFNLKRMEPQEYRGFAGLHQKLNQTKEDENRIQQKMKDVQERMEQFMRAQEDIYAQVNELGEVQLNLRVLLLSSQEKQQSFQFGFSVALDGFYKRLEEVKARLCRVNTASVANFKVDSEVIERVDKLGLQLVKLLQ